MTRRLPLLLCFGLLALAPPLDAQLRVVPDKVELRVRFGQHELTTTLRAVLE